MKRINTKGFTLVELLIVIALIAILSVAVLATINPIEQANKARDAATQNDAAEVMNAYERYYANSQSYPWMLYGPAGAKPSVEDAVVLRSDATGFGICDAGNVLLTPVTVSDSCSSTSVTPGVLIESDELKSSFVGKAAFQKLFEAVAVDEEAMWLVKGDSASGGVYVCYVPKAKSNRQIVDKLYCISGGVPGNANISLCKAGDAGCRAGACVAEPVSGAGVLYWDNPTGAINEVAASTHGIFRCVPE